MKLNVFYRNLSTQRHMVCIETVHWYQNQCSRSLLTTRKVRVQELIYKSLLNQSKFLCDFLSRWIFFIIFPVTPILKWFYFHIANLLSIQFLKNSKRIISNNIFIHEKKNDENEKRNLRYGLCGKCYLKYWLVWNMKT